MKTLRFLVTICALLIFSSFAFGSEGHDVPAPVVEFHLDQAHMKVRIEPEFFKKSATPKVIVTVTDHIAGSPILDAELYVLVERKGQTAAHKGHTSPPRPGGDASDEGGLDFGDSPAPVMKIDLSTFRKLSPQQKAGVFAVDYPLAEKGEYVFTLAVKSVGGRKYNEPLTYGSAIVYQEESRAPLYRMVFAIGMIILSGVTGIWIMSVRRSAKAGTGQGMNLLDIGWVRRFMTSPWFQPAFQIPVFLFFLLIIAAGLIDVQMGDRNMATLLMWTIWWAAIIFTFVLVGRVWCLMCPFGAAQDWIGRVISFNRDFPKPLRNIYLSTFIFFGLTWWDSFSGIVNKPLLTSYLLIGFFAVAVVMAVIFKGRSFCRYVCPIGGLIGLYSMFSPVELRNRCPDVCRKHEIKECIRGTESGYPCPMFETPMTLDRNNYCNFCGECVKSCSQNNIAVRFRSFAKDLWASAKGYFDEAYLAMALVGLTIVMTGEMVEPWHKWMDAIGKAIPFEAAGIMNHASREKATFLVVLTVGSLLVPMALLFVTAYIVKRKSGTDSALSLKDTAVRFAYMFIPVGLSMHLAHNVSHLFKEGPGIIPAVRRALNEFVNAGLGAPDWEITPLMGPESIFWLQMGILIIFNIFSLYAGYRIAVRDHGKVALKAFAPMAALAVFFMVINVFILGQPMALRHSH